MPSRLPIRFLSLFDLLSLHIRSIKISSLQPGSAQAKWPGQGWQLHLLAPPIWHRACCVFAVGCIKHAAVQQTFNIHIEFRSAFFFHRILEGDGQRKALPLLSDHNRPSGPFQTEDFCECSPGHIFYGKQNPLFHNKAVYPRTTS